jgi:FKBP-type peptidyl-prolyl cis-trans isomerase (trigger factor)
VVVRKVSADAAREKGIKVTTDELQEAADAFRSEYGLGKATDTENWLKSNGISLEAFEDYIETNLLIDKLKVKLETERDKDKEKVLALESVKNYLREAIYQDWIEKELE